MKSARIVLGRLIAFAFFGNNMNKNGRIHLFCTLKRIFKLINVVSVNRSEIGKTEAVKKSVFVHKIFKFRLSSLKKSFQRFSDKRNV